MISNKISEQVLKEIILNAKRKGWLQENKSGYPLMLLSEVEKCMMEAITETQKLTAQEIFKEIGKFAYHSDIEGVTLNLDELEEFVKKRGEGNE